MPEWGFRLALIQPAIVERCDEFLGPAAVGVKVPCVFARQRDPHDMAKIIRPDAIQPVAACGRWSGQARLIAGVFSEDREAPL